MSSIIRLGDTFHGISVESRGVFINDKYGWTYAGQCRDGYACGLGVLTYFDGLKDYAEHGPDGQYDGRNLCRWADGTTWHYLFERGVPKESARVYKRRPSLVAVRHNPTAAALQSTTTQ